MGFKGSLESINLADIFQNLALNQQTGTLKISSGGGTRHVYFKDGAVRLFSRAKRRGNRLGEMVVGRGLATLDQVEDALERQQETGRLLGEILVEDDIISQEDLNSLIRYQIEEDVYETFFLKGGDFEFIDGEPLQDIFDPEQESVEVSVNTSSLIMEAARRLDEWDRMREQIPSTTEIFLPQPALEEMAERGELEPLEARLLDFLDGGRDVDDVVEESSFSRFEVMSTLVGFLDRGFIRSSTLDDLAEAGEMCRREGRVRHVIKIYERMLAKGVDTPELRANLADAATELEEYDKAAIHYGVLAQHYLESGSEDHAVDILQKIVKLIPKHVPSRTLLAEVFASRGDVEKAMPHYATLVQVLFEGGRLSEAERYAGDALSLDPENLDVLQVLSRVHMARKEKTKAAEVLVRMGDIFVDTNRTRTAEEMYRRASLVDPSSEDARSKLQVLQQKERASKARPALWAVLALLGVLVLAAGVGFGVNEVYAGATLAGAVDEFGWKGKPDVLLKALAAPSLRVDPRPAVRLLVDAELRKEKEELLAQLERERGERRLQAEMKEARRLFEDHMLTEAREALLPLASREDFPDIARQASGLLADIRRIEEDFSEYRRWLSEHEGNPDTLRREYEIKKAFADKYPWSEEARRMKLPLLIKTTPSGVDVYVGGNFVGPSPYLLYYRPGQRLEVEVRKRGFCTRSRTFVNPSADDVVVVLAMGRKPLWSANCGGRVEIAPVIVEDRIIVADRVGRIAAFDRRTGEKAWDYTVSPGGLGDVASPLAYYGGRLFFGSADSRLRAVRLLPNGARELWSLPTTGKVLAGCAVRRLELLNSDLFVFAADTNGMVYCVSANNGLQVWSKSVAARVEADVGITDRTLYVADTSGGVAGMDVVTGEIQWRVRLRSQAGGFVPYRDSFICAAGREVFAFGWDARPEPPAWSYTAGKSVSGPPSVIAGRCYVGEVTGRLHCLDAGSGKTLWTPPADLDASVSMPVAGNDRRLYAVDANGGFYAFDASNRNLRWRYDFRKVVMTGCAYSEGMVYVVTREGALYAFEDHE